MAVKVKTELHPTIEELPIIFKDGKPMAVVVDIKQFQLLLDRLEELEDRELFSDPEIIAGLQAGQDDHHVSFAPGKKATGIELNDHILLRINKAERRAIGLTFFEYSLLAQRTEVGPRSFPLTGLAQLSDELREIALDIVLRPPVSDILSLSAYTPSSVETIPITSLQPLPAATA